MKAEVLPFNGLSLNPVQIPSSKSETHRAIITASLAEGTSYIRSVSESVDILATMEAMKKLGASFEKDGDTLIIHGTEDMHAYDGSLVDCAESGSTLRFLIPVFLTAKNTASFTGRGRLLERPLNVYEEMEELSFRKEKSQITVSGMFEKDVYEVRGDVSSQFISGLLFALPLLDHDTELKVTGPFTSREYVTMTVHALKRAGVEIEQDGLVYRMRGNQKYQPFDCVVDGDDSQAAFFGVLSAITGKEMILNNVRHDSLQSDHGFLEILKEAGCGINESNDFVNIQGKAEKNISVSLQQIPDLGPVLFALASTLKGNSVFTDAGRLRIKESDRIACMEEELRKMGVSIHSDDDTVYVEGTENIHGNVVLDGHNDHRIVMALSVLACIADGPVVIEGAEAVNKSYPSFFADLKKCGVEVSYGS